MRDLILFLATLVSLGTAKPVKLDKCHLFPKAKLGVIGEIIDVDIPRGCREGLVEWRNPAGTLRLSAEKLAGYSLCVEQTEQTWAGNLRVLGIDSHEPLPITPPGHLSCVHDQFGRADIMLLAYPMLSDTVSFTYVIINYDFS